MPPPPTVKAKTESWAETLLRGPWLEALCIGVDAYEHLKKLDNAVADAAALANGIQGTCSATAHNYARSHVLQRDLTAPSPIPFPPSSPARDPGHLTCRPLPLHEIRVT